MLLIGKMKKRKTGRKRDKEGGKEQEKEKKEKQRGGEGKIINSIFSMFNVKNITTFTL